jgi:hypothetical protein
MNLQLVAQFSGRVRPCTKGQLRFSEFDGYGLSFN